MNYLKKFKIFRHFKTLGVSLSSYNKRFSLFVSLLTFLPKSILVLLLGDVSANVSYTNSNQLKSPNRPKLTWAEMLVSYRFLKVFHEVRTQNTITYYIDSQKRTAMSKAL